MTARTLKELLACMPDDVLELPIELDVGDFEHPFRMILIDPPNNFENLRPRIVFSTSDYGEENPEIFCKVTARHR